VDRFRSNPDPTAPRLLRTHEAARYLGMGSKAIRNLILSGRLPYVQMKPGNSPFLLDRRDLDRFIDVNKTPALDQFTVKSRSFAARGEP
jgi:excisionase family DNA binding protein